MTYDNFRFLDLGDLTKKKELGLVCPNNLIGAVDVYLTTHHGLDQSNAKAIVDAVHPRVAIMNNGAKKGAQPRGLADYPRFAGIAGLVAASLRARRRQGT